MDLNAWIAIAAIVVGGLVGVGCGFMGGYFVRRNRREEADDDVKERLGRVEGQINAGGSHRGYSDTSLPERFGELRAQVAGVRGDVLELTEALRENRRFAREEHESLKTVQSAQQTQLNEMAKVVAEMRKAVRQLAATISRKMQPRTT